MTGIIASLPEELARLKAVMENVKEVQRGPRTFYEGKIAGEDIAAVICGIGKVNGACTAQALIDAYSPCRIIHTGVAGSLDERAGHLSLVISTELMYHDMDLQWIDNTPSGSVFPADEMMAEALYEAALGFGKAEKGRMVTGDRFIDSKAVKEDIKARCGGLCVDMEVAATAHAARLAGIPYCAVKCISDMADDGAGGTFEDFLALAADKAAGTVIDALGRL